MTWLLPLLARCASYALDNRTDRKRLARELVNALPNAALYAAIYAAVYEQLSKAGKDELVTDADAQRIAVHALKAALRVLHD